MSKSSNLVYDRRVLLKSSLAMTYLFRRDYHPTPLANSIFPRTRSLFQCRKKNTSAQTNPIVYTHHTRVSFIDQWYFTWIYTQTSKFHSYKENPSFIQHQTNIQCPKNSNPNRIQNSNQSHPD